MRLADTASCTCPFPSAVSSLSWSRQGAQSRRLYALVQGNHIGYVGERLVGRAEVQDLFRLDARYLSDCPVQWQGAYHALGRRFHPKEHINSPRLQCSCAHCDDHVSNAPASQESFGLAIQGVVVGTSCPPRPTLPARAELPLNRVPSYKNK